MTSVNGKEGGVPPAAAAEDAPPAAPQESSGKEAPSPDPEAAIDLESARDRAS